MTIRKALDPLVQEIMGGIRPRPEGNYPVPEIRAEYSVPVVRGVTRVEPRASDTRKNRWWFPREETDSANYFSYANVSDKSDKSPTTLLGRLNSNGFLVVDAGGQSWNRIPLGNLPRDVREKLVTDDPRSPVNTNLIAEIASDLGYPGVHFRKVKEDNGITSDQYYVADLSRRRGEFANFRDNKSDNFMAGTLMSLLGGGGAAALSSDNEES